jgi:hypothetical protein
MLSNLAPEPSMIWSLAVRLALLAIEVTIICYRVLACMQIPRNYVFIYWPIYAWV